MKNSHKKQKKLQEEKEKLQFCRNCNKAWPCAAAATTIFVTFYDCIN